jgi:DNA replicative helicase MCM subunit Mcm2 (Cdc46/Mcm family)
MGAKDINVPALVRVRISGETQQKATHTKYNACCRCGEAREIDLLAPEMRSILIQILVRNCPPDIAIKDTLPSKGDERHTHFWTLTPVEASDYRILKARDIVGLEETSEKSLVTRDYTVYYLNSLNSNKALLADGEVFADPGDNDLTFLAVHANSLASSAENFQLDQKDIPELKKLSALNYEDVLALADCTIARNIVGRGLAKVSSLVSACSANWFRIDGFDDPVAGCVRTMFVGDKRTGKGTIVRWYYQTLALSEHGIGESSSRAGLLYCVDSDSKMIVWGLLPQADLGLATIEGMHGVPADQLAEFREALVQQKVRVSKKVTGEAWCRARIIADANPSKNLKDFVFPAQALLSVPCFFDPVDLTRWDLFVPFDEDSVSMKRITDMKAPPGQPLPLDVLRNLVMFAWSRKIDQIRVTREAIEYAKQTIVERLSQYKLGEIPLIHNASFLSLLRVSVAFAIVTFSAEGENVFVLERHVKMAERLIKELLEQWAIEDYVQFAGAAPISEEELDEHTAWLNGKEVARAVLKELSSRSWQGNDLAARTGFDNGSIRNTMSELRSRELVKRRANGYDLTGKGAALAKRLFFEKNSKDNGTSLSDQVQTAVDVSRKMVNELNGDNPLRSEYIKRLAENGIKEPERLVEILEHENLIYAPTPDHIRATRF